MYPKIHIGYVFPLAFKRHYASDVLITFYICFNNEVKDGVLVTFKRQMNLVSLVNLDNNKKNIIPK